MPLARSEQWATAVFIMAALLGSTAVLRWCAGHPAEAPKSSRAGEDTFAAASPPLSAIVVGSGIAGLSAAFELSRGGADVTIVDVASVFGGHAVMATADLCIVGTPFQEEKGIHDSPELALHDFKEWGEDPDPDWSRYYAEHSRTEIYDWLTGLGESFELLIQPAGNSVPRTHRTRGRGIGLVTPIFRECAKRPNVHFVWNRRVGRLLTADRRVVGVEGVDERTGKTTTLRAGVVVLATGGFQSNLERVRAAWSKDVPMPERFLIGSGIHSTGSGLDLAAGAGAALARLDHQWNYITGLPDPRFPGEERGLNAVNPDSIWVNSEGKRFIAERASPKVGFAVVAQQKGSMYWSIFDESTKHAFWVAGTDFAKFESVERELFSRPELVKTAPTLEKLAGAAGLPAADLRATIDHFNEMADRRVDLDFGTFGSGKTRTPHRIEKPPFYAVQFFPLTRKSMGGVVIDAGGRAVDGAGRAVLGLYAAGEVAGLGGVNGKAALEGTFLGPSMVTGRVAGRTALAELEEAMRQAQAASLGARAEGPPPVGAPAHAAASGVESAGTVLAQPCQSCHPLAELTAHSRKGYWHFEKVHTVVLKRGSECALCHAEMHGGFNPEAHRIDRLAQSNTCPRCHSGEDL